ncbi:MAG: hypothetical protein K1060chlam3_00255 [Candidatus Anoxychlamydiales bacterium]|nr:hypothetical protein [Candidatus Anoxychlamydiales bacterium]
MSKETTEIQPKTKRIKYNISFTKDEFNEWSKARLIPDEILKKMERRNELNRKSPHSSRKETTFLLNDILKYVSDNIEKLHAHYKHNVEEDKYQITLPNPDKMGETYELQVIEKSTGKVVKTLEQRTAFELCEGILLQIKAKEAKDWKKETALAKELTDEQKKDLKLFIENLGGKRPLTRKEIVTFIEELKRIKTSNLPAVKMPVNMFNVMLTDRNSTLEKLKEKINEINRKIKKTSQEKALTNLKKYKVAATKILERAKKNFPEDFYFPVYQHYAIFGGMKLLHTNNFKPVEFSPSAVLDALNFPNINKSEITEIKKAFAILTVDKFPCYYVREDKNDPNVFHSCDADSPIFMIYCKGKTDLNIDISQSPVFKETLYLCLLNPALIDDMDHFFTIVDSNILANLRNYTKVATEDLYFIEFLIRENRFRTKTETNLDKACRIIKKTEWLKNGVITDRDKKRRIKEKVKKLLNFAKGHGLVSDFSIEKNGEMLIEYQAKTRQPLLIR